MSKTKISDLDNDERLAFLKWGGYSIKYLSPQDGNNNDNTASTTEFVVLDESNQQFSKRGLQRGIKRYFQSINRSKYKKLKKSRKRKREKENDIDLIMAPALKRTRRKLRSKNLRDFVNEKLKNNPDAPHIILDCRFDSLMDNKQIVSVSTQIRQLYALNNKSPHIPCHIFATSFCGRLKNQFQPKDKGNDMKNLVHKNDQTFQNVIDIWCMKFISDSFENYFKSDIQNQKKEVIYLTADSDNELDCIESNKLYVIGAFVDKNKHKNYTLNLAVKNNWKHASLPILKYMKLSHNNIQQTRLVITINQVFSILAALANWNNDWRKALQFAFPARKGFILKDPLPENEIKKLVFDGNFIDIKSDKYKKSNNNNNNSNCNKNDTSNDQNEDDDLLCNNK